MIMSDSEHEANTMTWDEFERLVDVLAEKLVKHFGGADNIHVISQLHRAGGIVGSMLAVKLRVEPLLPVQFTYRYHPTSIEQISSVPEILVPVPEEMNVVLAEGNTSSGSIAMRAAAAIHERYPKARIHLATLTKVYGGFETLEGIEEVFCSIETNEKGLATPEEATRLGLRPGITVFPWERTEDELADINSL